MEAQTVLGPVSADQLGVTLMHEHVLVDLTCYWSEPDDPADRELARVRVSDVSRCTILGTPVGRTTMMILDNLVLDDIRMAAAELEHFGNAGGETIVDLTLDGIGTGPHRRRNILGVREVSDVSGVHIVAGTGYYVHLSHPGHIADSSAAELAGEMVTDLEEGIAGTGVKAGIIGEIGLSAEPHPDELKVLEAAALASLETGVTISLHIEPGSPTGHRAAEWLLGRSVPASRIVVGHVDGFIDRGYLAALLALGVTIEFEGFHLDGWKGGRFGFDSATDAERIEVLARLVDEGFAPQIVLAQDLCTKQMYRRYGGVGYDFVPAGIVPRLKDAGVATTAIEIMLEKNPAKLLTR